MFSFRDTENIVKYRLSPSELNLTLYQILLKYNLELQSESVNQFHLVTVQDKKFVICPMSKDAESIENETNLPFVGDLIREYSANFSDKNVTLLMPLRLCRGYLKIPTSITQSQRKHAVLLTVDLSSNIAQVHDSQGWLRQFFYPDKLIQLNGKILNYDPEINYHPYGKQDDSYSCGYYVLRYIENFLRTGSAIGCEEIELNIAADYPDKNAFLKSQGIEIEQGEGNAIIAMDEFDEIFRPQM